MKKFNSFEIKSILIILLCLFVVSGVNIASSLRRGRDATRKNDVSAIQKSIDTYYQKYRIFPLSTDDGLIIGCFDEDVVRDVTTGYPLNAKPCVWGESRFENVNLMPRDPKYLDGSSYKYISDGKKYEIYIALEGKDEPEYSQITIYKNLQCGNKICNHGRSSI